jgi:hypothetical protein
MDTASLKILRFLEEEDAPFDIRPAVVREADASVQPLCEMLSHRLQEIIAQDRARVCVTRQDATQLWRVLSFFGIPLEHKAIVAETLAVLSKRTASYQITEESEPAGLPAQALWLKNTVVPAVLKQWEQYEFDVGWFNRERIAQYYRSHPRNDPYYSRFFERVKWSELWDNELWNLMNFAQMEYVDTPAFGKPRGKLPQRVPPQTPEEVARRLRFKVEVPVACAHIARRCAQAALLQTFIASSVHQVAASSPKERKAELQFQKDFEFPEIREYRGLEEFDSKCRQDIQTCYESVAHFVEALEVAHSKATKADANAEMIQALFQPIEIAANALLARVSEKVQTDFKLVDIRRDDLIGRASRARIDGEQVEMKEVYAARYYINTLSLRREENGKIRDSFGHARRWISTPKANRHIFRWWGHSAFKRWRLQSTQLESYYTTRSQEIESKHRLVLEENQMVDAGGLDEQILQRAELRRKIVARQLFENTSDMLRGCYSKLVEDIEDNQWMMFARLKNTAVIEQILKRCRDAYQGLRNLSNLLSSRALADLGPEFKNLQLERKAIDTAERGFPLRHFFEELADLHKIVRERMTSWSRVASENPRVETSFLYRFMHRSWRLLHGQDSVLEDLSEIDRIPNSAALLNDFHSKQLVGEFMLSRIREDVSFYCSMREAKRIDTPETKKSDEQANDFRNTQNSVLQGDLLAVSRQQLSDLVVDKQHSFANALEAMNMSQNIAEEYELPRPERAAGAGADVPFAVPHESLAALRLFSLAKQHEIKHANDLKWSFTACIMICLLTLKPAPRQPAVPMSLSS